MKLLTLLFALLFVSSNAFVPNMPQPSALSTQRTPIARPSTELAMGGKMAKFGVFSPAVYVAKIALGTEKLNKLRGKAISLHSQYIG